MARRLAAILAADAVGFSKLMATHEAETLAALQKVRSDIFDPRTSAHRGRLVKLIGDGALYEFSSVVDAVNCAVAIQKEMQAKARVASGSTALRFRIGIHLADVIVDGDDLYGDGVNIAARIEAEAKPGGIALSEEAYRQIRGKIDYALEDLGERHLKNIPGTIRLHGVDFENPTSGASVFEAVMGERPTPPEKPSVAILPFRNMSADPQQDYFADGITEDLITELGRAPNLFVIARNSVFAFRDRRPDVGEVSHDLGVRFVVQGSVRRAGNRIRVAVQLVDTEHDAQIWAERYDGDLDDIFDVQEEITRSIAGAVAPQIDLAEVARARIRSAPEASAYDSALKATALFDDALRSGSPEMLQRSLDLSEAALTKDRQCTLALLVAAKALGYKFLYRWGDDPGRDLDLAREKVEAVFAIDGSDARAYTHRGMIHHFRADYDAAIADFRRATELNPNYAFGFFLLAWAESLEGLTDEAAEHVSVGLRLSPRESDSNLGHAYLALAQAAFAKADFPATLKWGRLAIQMHPKAPIRRALVIAASAFEGDLAEAELQRKFLDTFSPDFLASLRRGDITLYRMSSDQDRLIEGLLLAVEQQ